MFEPRLVEQKLDVADLPLDLVHLRELLLLDEPGLLRPPGSLLVMRLVAVELRPGHVHPLAAGVELRLDVALLPVGFLESQKLADHLVHVSLRRRSPGNKRAGLAAGPGLSQARAVEEALELAGRARGAAACGWPWPRSGGRARG